MRLVYAHFPINIAVVRDGAELEIRNYLGEKIIRKVEMLEGVKVIRSENVKDEVVLVGNDIEKVSQSGTK
jgi:large subunit ribosomal protein L9e